MKKSFIKNVPNIPNNYCEMVFGRQLDYRNQLQKYISSAKQIYLSQKRQSYSKAIKEFKSLYKPANYYIPGFNCGSDCYDDSFIVYFAD